MRTVIGNQIIETQLEKDIDNFQPQPVIDTICDWIVGITMCVCLIMAFINVTEDLWEKRIEKLFKKKEK